ncbi:MAG: hypothetical protein R2749_09040 [Acidimicrobiales bacterium]
MARTHPQRHAAVRHRGQRGRGAGGGERIAAVISPAMAEDLAATCDRVIDAAGCYVLPGGIDVHTHMELPFGGTNASDTFETGTIAAAVEARPPSWTSPCSAMASWSSRARGLARQGGRPLRGRLRVPHDRRRGGRRLAAVDAPARGSRGHHQLQAVHGLPGVFYSDDGAILRAMQVAADCGAMLMMHAENGIAIDVLVEQALGRGETDPRYHSLTRPVELEEEATNRAIALARVADCPLYIVHMSAREAVEAVARARNLGANVFGETCPQYLYLSLEDTCRPRLRGGQVRVLHAAALGRRAASATCGGSCAPTTCRWSAPTTARSASRSRRSWAG